MDVIVTTTISLLLIATVVALIARRLAFPYTVGLVITGIGLVMTRNDMGVVLTHDFIFDVILPPLLFEAAINLHWKELRRDALPILTLALIGTLVSAAVVATGMVFFLVPDNLALDPFCTEIRCDRKEVVQRSACRNGLNPL